MGCGRTKVRSADKSQSRRYVPVKAKARKANGVGARKTLIERLQDSEIDWLFVQFVGCYAPTP